jgi:type I site-specific restriction-modification system R (restriction) subunit
MTLRGSLQAVFTIVAALGIAVCGARAVAQAQTEEKETTHKSKSAKAAKVELPEVEALQKAKDDLKEARKALKALETEIVDGQPADSPVGQAHAAFLAADKQYKAAQDEALNTAEYKEKFEQAKATDDTAVLATLRKDTLDNDANVQAALATLRQARGAYEPLRSKLLKADEKWIAADKDVQEKTQAVTDAQKALVKAKADERKEAAEAKKAALEAAIQANQRQPRRRNGTPIPNPTGN